MTDERDRTPDAQRDRDLFESERSFRLLVQGVADYALYMLDKNGQITSWNVGGQRIKGYAPHEIIGQHFSRFYTPTDQADGKPARALKIAAEQGKYEEEGWRVRKDGTFFWASVVIDPLREGGELIGFAKITRHITERREAQQKLERMQRQLAESQKLDALGQLTGGVAHDFNNLLMVLNGNIHSLKRIVGDNPKALRALQSLEVASKRGAALTNQLLTFARRQSVNPQVISIAERVDAVRDFLHSGVGRTIQIVIDIEDGVWPVTVDVTEFETALVNLTVNSRDAMPEGGTITISARNVRIDDDAAPGDYVAVSIGDSGIGIPPDIIAKVFDPFFTTKPVGKGTGLGLSQVHGFAHQAGGTVKVESELGKGTKVTMCLPRGVAEQETVREQSDAPEGSGTVLLVEDNPDVAAASSDFLEQLGYAVRWVSSAEEALEALENNGIDLVFSDIVMPGKMDGLGLARTIQAKRPSLPILLTTGYRDARRVARLDFPLLRKPFQIHDLSEAISKLRN
jgi:PAS domain S-box-containing protein